MKLLANDGIHSEAAKTLSAHGFEILEVKVAQNQLKNYINTHAVEVLLVRSATQVDSELILGCPSLKIIARAGVGLDNIDVSAARKKGILVLNTPEASTNAVVELAFAHLLGSVRFLHDSNRNMPLEGDTQFAALKQNYSQGVELRGKTLGIIGLGHTGKAMAQMALAMGMNVLACDISLKTETLRVSIGHHTVSIDISTVEKETLLQESDFISLHLPYNGEVCLSEEAFSQMKKGVGIVNISRGELVDEKALITALDEDRASFAALDVFQNEPTPSIALLMHPKVSLSPHIGGSTREAQQRIFAEIATQLINIKNQINK